jgi:hypothetical protein
MNEKPHLANPYNNAMTNELAIAWQRDRLLF